MYSDHPVFKCPVPTKGQENRGQIVHYLDHHLNNRPFDWRTTFSYSDPQCKQIKMSTQTFQEASWKLYLSEA